MTETTVASVNSALQRARAAVRDRVPGRSQQATLRALGDRGLRELVDRYVEAWERCDVDAFTALHPVPRTADGPGPAGGRLRSLRAARTPPSPDNGADGLRKIVRGNDIRADSVRHAVTPCEEVRPMNAMSNGCSPSSSRPGG